MTDIVIESNESGQRLDRFLRKYLKNAPLSFIYRLIRKDVKVNHRRVGNDYMLEEGDILSIYVSAGELAKLKTKYNPLDTSRPKKTFRVVYEDENILIADKPAGLLTHGDSYEKSDHLANQVIGYLAAKGEYDPAAEKTFSPAPVNRLDRNTSGLVIFAKTYDALKMLNEKIRNRESIRKFYKTLLVGRLDRDLVLEGDILKDEDTNTSTMVDINGVGSPETGAGPSVGRSTGSADTETSGAPGTGEIQETDPAKHVLTRVMPEDEILIDGELILTLAEVEIETGRTHQIRVQVADAGHPIAGDPKYGDPVVNRKLKERFGVRAQLLTAARLEFGDMGECLVALSGKTFEATLPKVFTHVVGNYKDARHKSYQMHMYGKSK